MINIFILFSDLLRSPFLFRSPNLLRSHEIPEITWNKYRKSPKRTFTVQDYYIE